MKIGILEAGRPPAALMPAFGGYDGMTSRLLGDGHSYRSYAVLEGHFPERNAECEAYVVTGSACSVYDELPWISRLQAFLRIASNGGAKLVGICFGHQIMAQAFGGRVEKSSKGWGLGLHRYNIVDRTAWMGEAEFVYATASHQDQVTKLPPRCKVVGSSDLTPHAILAYDAHSSISVQFHPEFEPAYSRALFAARSAPDLSNDQIAEAIASLSRSNDNLRLGQYINNFLLGPTGRDL